MVRWLDDEKPRNWIPTLRRDLLRVASDSKCVYKGEMIRDSSQMATFVPVLEKTIKVVNALSRTDQVDYASRGVETLKLDLRSSLNEQRAHDAQFLKALDECYSSKNYVRKFLRALHPKWRAKVTAIKESKDLTSLSLDELIRNLKVYEMIIKKDSEIVKAKVVRKSLALKAKKESSDEECLTSRRQEPKSICQRLLDDSGKEDDEKVNNEMCLVAQASSESLRLLESHGFAFFLGQRSSGGGGGVLSTGFDGYCRGKRGRK
nr:UBN2 domain-containing protein [Tanacetum cinerariifolium]